VATQFSTYVRARSVRVKIGGLDRFRRSGLCNRFRRFPERSFFVNRRRGFFFFEHLVTCFTRVRRDHYHRELFSRNTKRVNFVRENSSLTRHVLVSHFERNVDNTFRYYPSSMWSPVIYDLTSNRGDYRVRFATVYVRDSSSLFSTFRSSIIVLHSCVLKNAKINPKVTPFF